MKAQLVYILILIFNILFQLTPSLRLRNVLLRLSGSKIGRNVSIHSPTRFFYFKDGLTIGNHVTVNPECFLDNRGNINIGDNVNISHCVKIYTGGHNIKSASMAYTQKDVLIGNNVWIFPNVTIMPGVTIGDGAVILPCAVVTKDVAAYDVVGGFPARKIDERDKTIDYKIKHDKWFIF